MSKAPRQPAPKNAPTVVTPPAVTGEPIVGQTLNCSDGEWDLTPESVAYQWRADDVNVSGANTNSYPLIASDVGKMIHCIVTATNVDGSDSAPSNAVGPVKTAMSPTEPGTAGEMRTIADEQRLRSATIQQMGVDEWKDAHDDRPPEERSANRRQVEGVGPSQISEDMSPQPGSWKGSTRSTPEARNAQRKAAP